MSPPVTVTHVDGGAEPGEGLEDCQDADIQTVKELVRRKSIAHASFGPWSVLIIVLLRERPMRYSELERQIETVSKKMVTSTLRYLERDGFVSRAVTPPIPPRVDYQLTDLCRGTRSQLEPVAQQCNVAGRSTRLIGRPELRKDRPTSPKRKGK